MQPVPVVGEMKTSFLLYEKVLFIDVSPTTKQGNVWLFKQQTATTFQPMVHMGSPAYGQIVHARENLFQLHLVEKAGLRDPKLKCPKNQ